MHNCALQILENYHCIPEEAGGASFLETAPRIQCTLDSSVSPYLFQLLLPSIFFSVVYIIGFPVLLWLLLFRNRNQLHSPEMETMLGFVYENFKHQFYWFEILLMGRRIAIVTILSVAPIIFGEVSVLLILSFFLLVYLFLHPYEERDEVNSEIVGTTSILILLIIGVFYQDNYVHGSTSYSWLNWLGLTIYLLTLLYLLGELLYPQLSKTKLWKILRCKKGKHDSSEYIYDELLEDQSATSLKDINSLQ